MPTTSPWNIPYPDGPTNLTPLQTHFANIANAVNSALTDGLGGAPRIANSDAERNSLIPAPVQGNTVLRPDKGYTEQYFGLYNSSTNPSGATPAGWYPVSGKFPRAIARKGTAVSIPNAAFTAATYDTLKANLITQSGAGLVTIITPGVYDVFASLTFGTSGTGQRIVQVYKNGVVHLGSGQSPSTGGITSSTMSTSLDLAAGDTLQMYIYHNAGGALNSPNGATYDNQFIVTYRMPSQ